MEKIIWNTLLQKSTNNYRWRRILSEVSRGCSLDKYFVSRYKHCILIKCNISASHEKFTFSNHSQFLFVLFSDKNIPTKPLYYFHHLKYFCNLENNRDSTIAWLVRRYRITRISSSRHTSYLEQMQPSLLILIQCSLCTQIEPHTHVNANARNGPNSPNWIANWSKKSGCAWNALNVHPCHIIRIQMHRRY